MTPHFNWNEAVDELIRQFAMSCYKDINIEKDEKFKQSLTTAVKQLVETAKPEKKPRVVKRKGYYPPFQPQVEQHKREGYNQAIDDMEANLLKAIGDKS